MSCSCNVNLNKSGIVNSMPLFHYGLYIILIGGFWVDQKRKVIKCGTDDKCDKKSKKKERKKIIAGVTTGLHSLHENKNSRLGKCYKYAYRHVTSGNSGWNLVHGVITDKIFSTGRSLDHAWAEKGNKVYDPTLDKIMSKVVYYSLFAAEPYAVYTEDEVYAKASEFGHYGPWDSRLKKFKPKGF